MGENSNDNDVSREIDLIPGFLRMDACNENDIDGYYIRSTCCNFLPSTLRIIKKK